MIFFEAKPPELSPLIQIIQQVNVTETPEVQKEYTIEEKIAQNFYKCDESIEWIRKDTAECKLKTESQSNKAQSPVKTARGESTGNLYTPGNCTWYAKSRRPDLPNNLNNARTWATKASAQGFTIGTTPQAGAIGQKGNHVIYIESVNSDGTMNISDMNYQSLYEITHRTISSVGWTFIY